MLALAGRSALADQCAWVTKDQGDRAAALLRAGPAAFLEYCEPCGDAPPTKASPKPIAIDATGQRAIEVRSVNDDAVEVFVNGSEVDLAYTFVRRGTDEWRNVARLVGCEATDVSDVVRIPGDGAPAPKAKAKAKANANDRPSLRSVESELTAALAHLDSIGASGEPDAEAHVARARRALEAAVKELQLAQQKR